MKKRNALQPSADRMKALGRALKLTWQAYFEREVARESAVIAFYAILSLAPLLIFLATLASQWISQQHVQEQLVDFTRAYLGMDQKGLGIIQQVLRRAGSVRWSWEALLGLGLLLVSASWVFGELRTSLARILVIQKEEKKSRLAYLKNLIRSMGLVFATGFLGVIFLLFSPLVSILSSVLKKNLGSPWFFEIFGTVISLGVLSLSFTLIFRWVPSSRFSWRSLLSGGVFTSVLFSLGKTALSQYLIRNSTASLYGAAGSLVFLLLWIFYSTQMVLVGACFARALEEGPARRKI